MKLIQQFASNGVKPVIAIAGLHLIHLIDRHCWSRHAAQKHLISRAIGSTDLSFEFRQRNVLKPHIAALLIGDTILRFGLIVRVSTVLNVCRRVLVEAFLGMWGRTPNQTHFGGTG